MWSPIAWAIITCRHANRPDLMEMHKIIEPQMVIRCTVNTVICVNMPNCGKRGLCIADLCERNDAGPVGNRPKVTEYVETGACIWTDQPKLVRWMG